MCNCRQLPPCVAEIESMEWGFAFSGALIHKHYFETPERDYLEPQLDYSHSRCRCLECGQEWYIECSPEQTPFPDFAFKVNELMRLPSENEDRRPNSIYAYLRMVDLVQKSAGWLGAKIISFWGASYVIYISYSIGMLNRFKIGSNVVHRQGDKIALQNAWYTVGKSTR